MRLSNRGFSMVEALVGMLVLASTSVLVSSTMSSNQMLLERSKTSAEAVAIANQQLEWYVNVPETISVPSGMDVAQLRSLQAVSIPTLLDAANSSVLPNQMGLLSPSQQDFFYNKEMVITAAKIRWDDNVRKFQVSIYEKDPGTGARGRLLYMTSQLSGRLDPRSRSR
jgi:type II secretory pathway pseudopilin PulG